MAELDLLTSVDVFHDLHVVADVRKNIVKVNRQALLNLLIDHTCMLNALQRAAVKVTGPAPLRKRETLIE